MKVDDNVARIVDYNYAVKMDNGLYEIVGGTDDEGYSWLELSEKLFDNVKEVSDGMILLENGDLWGRNYEDGTFFQDGGNISHIYYDWGLFYVDRDEGGAVMFAGNFVPGESEYYDEIVRRKLFNNSAIPGDYPSSSTQTAANGLTANPTASTVLVNGEKVAFDAYNINGNNYFKLRDLAYVLNGTEKQFEVGWNEAANSISLTSGKPYITAGGEMTGKGEGIKTPEPTNSAILLNDQDVSFTAYNIEGNNYFKLRDIGAAIGFGVDWDGEHNTIVIDTSKGYTAE